MITLVYPLHGGHTHFRNRLSIYPIVMIYRVVPGVGNLDHHGWVPGPSLHLQKVNNPPTLYQGNLCSCLHYQCKKI